VTRRQHAARRAFGLDRPDALALARWERCATTVPAWVERISYGQRPRRRA
jgi:hypothetical protein